MDIRNFKCNVFLDQFLRNVNWFQWVRTMGMVSFIAFTLFGWAEDNSNEVYRVAVLDDPSLPVEGCATPLETIEQSLDMDGVSVESLTSEALADTRTFNRDRFDLLIVPTGETFPYMARETLLAFLRQGGDLLCTGGYAFDRPVLRQEGHWVPLEHFLDESRRQAGDPHVSLISNGDFERGHEGWVTASPMSCTIVRGQGFRGESCAQITTQTGARWETELRAQPGEMVCVGAHIRAQDIQGSGFGYMAVYQYNREGNLITFQDFGQVTKTRDWHRVEIPALEIKSEAVKVMFYGGLYLASGTLWIDDVTCAPVPKTSYINAHFGRPRDGLEIEADQLPIFSPDQPLHGVCLVNASDSPLEIEWQSPGEVTGLEATAQLHQNARWIPLIEALDAWGRNSGVAGALVRFDRGSFTASSWAIFGVRNRDIFASEAGMRLLQQTVRLLRTGVYGGPLKAERSLVRRGDNISIELELLNTSAGIRKAEVRLQLSALDGSEPIPLETKTLSLPADSNQLCNWKWRVPERVPDFLRLIAEVRVDGFCVDRIESGLCVADETVVQNGPAIRYENNAFVVKSKTGRTHRRLLFGTDTYGNMFSSRTYNPWLWYRDLQAMRDFRLLVYENLQFTPKDYRYTDAQFNQLDGLIQLSQRFALPYMAGLLIGCDVVVDDATLQRQAEMCRTFAERYRHVPGLIYYLNGDFRSELKDTPDIRRLWNEFLRDRYRTDDALRDAWSPHVPKAALGELPVEAYPAQAWYEVRTRDYLEFRTHLMRRWIDALCQAIRSQDAWHPITSEYYQKPWDGIDLRLTCESMDAANIGYFAPPGEDLAKLMATIKWNDMRLAGKTVNIGEFGVKTHEAWEPERGGTHYHIRRSEREQLQLFWWVTHAALAMHVTKIQNWCWSDDPDWEFPWGMAWNNPLRAKPVLKLYRNLRVFSDRVPREDRRADIVFVMSDRWRLGTMESLGYASLMNALEFLLAANVSFDLANLRDLPKVVESAPRAVILPLAYALPDDAVDALIRLAEQGSAVYLSGDPSIDPLGKKHDARLERLCGIKRIGENNHSLGFPVPSVTPIQAQPVPNRAQLSLYRFPCGQGEVWYTPEPWETAPNCDLFMDEPERSVTDETNLYLELLPQMGIHAPIQVKSESGVWRVVDTRETNKRLIALFPRKTDRSRVPVTLKYDGNTALVEVLENFPCSILLNTDQQPVAATGGGRLVMQNRELVRAESPWMLVALDGRSIEESSYVAMACVDPGRLWWRSQVDGMKAAIVEWREGRPECVRNVSLERSGDGWECQAEANELILIAPDPADPDALALLGD